MTTGRTKQRLILVFMMVAALAAAPMKPTAAAEAVFKDINDHWGKISITWAAQKGLVNGYGDGTFHPDDTVTESEFLAILLRAYPSAVAAGGAQDWAVPYYGYAAALKWPVSVDSRERALTRGDVARILSATQGKGLGTEAAVSFALTSGLAHGKTTSTIEGFAAGDSLTRAEAVQFVKNALDRGLTLTGKTVEPVPGGDAGAAANAVVTARGVSMGMTQNQVSVLLGEPARKDTSPYGFQWWIYNKDYAKYMQVGIKDGTVVALYSNTAVWKTARGIQVGSSAEEARKAFGTPLSYILKGDTRYMLNSRGEYDLFDTADGYATVFYDLHAGNTVTAIQMVQKQTEESLNGFYGSSSEALRQSYEHEIFDLANAVRVRMGKDAFLWNDAISDVARKHSEDMVNRNYFEHIDPDGKGPSDRATDDGIDWSFIGENIAAGQQSAIFAHEGWMNSEGHRENLLNDFQRLGVGVSFGGSMHVYYTENFYNPR